MAATTPLVDSIEEQRLLEQLLERGKPPIPPAATHLDALLHAPFRYPPPPGGSRFRGPNDPGVFYGAERVRTACAELGYWRWRHLADTPALEAMPSKPQTVFKAHVQAETVDLRKKPFVRDRVAWTHPRNYARCQAFARAVRDTDIHVIRYESVPDPEHDGCCAVFSPRAFVPPLPLEQQTWLLSVSRERVVWQRIDDLVSAAFEFPAAPWRKMGSPHQT